MRRNIEILWLEDELNSPAQENRVDDVNYILKEKGYTANIHQKKTFEEAYDSLKSKHRYDFFISDYNLNNSKTGLSYLEEIRRVNHYKQFVILYSNNEYKVIKEDIIKMLTEKEIDLFSNFTFFSLNDRRDYEYFERAIDIILCRWDELNAIRGRYMCENAELEYELRKRLNCFDNRREYKKLIHEFYNEKTHQNSKSKYRKLRDKWLELADKRNMLAHVKENYDIEKGYYIESNVDYTDKQIKIFESELDSERKMIIELKQKILDYLDKPY